MLEKRYYENFVAICEVEGGKNTTLLDYFVYTLFSSVCLHVFNQSPVAHSGTEHTGDFYIVCINSTRCWTTMSGTLAIGLPLT